jgi:hypothetical protein
VTRDPITCIVAQPPHQPLPLPNERIPSSTCLIRPSSSLFIDPSCSLQLVDLLQLIVSHATKHTIKVDSTNAFAALAAGAVAVGVGAGAATHDYGVVWLVGWLFGKVGCKLNLGIDRG